MNQDRRTVPQPKAGSSAGFWIVLTIWILVLGLAAAAVASLVMVYRGDRILAGVTSLGVDLRGATQDFAARLLDARWSEHAIVLESDAGQWTLPPEQLGIELDAQATAAQALRRGRTVLAPETVLPLAQRLLATVLDVQVDVEALPVAPAWRFDRAQAAETLRTLASQLAVDPQNAGVAVVNGMVQTTAPVTGRSLDISAMVATLETRPWDILIGGTAAQSGTALPLPLVNLQPDISDVSSIVAEVEPLLQKPIAIRIYDAIHDERLAWSAGPADLGRWVKFTSAAGGDSGGAASLTWAVDEEAVAAYVAGQNGTLDGFHYVDPEEAVPALIEAFTASQPEIRLLMRHAPREHVVKSGETLSSIATDYGMPYPWLLPDNQELGDMLLVGDTVIIPSPDALAPLPPVENKRIIVSLSKQTVQAFEDGGLKWSWPASTGLPDQPTSPGVFQIQTHEETGYAGQWQLHMPWFMGIYHPAPHVETMNGFHGFPRKGQQQLLWTNDLGRPVTYGCILLSTDNAKLLYDWAEEGVIVEITP